MPTRPTALVILSYLALFLGAGALGGFLSRGLAPGSWPAEAVGFFALPVAFAVGLQLWFGLALLSVVLRFERLAFEVAVGLLLLAALGLTRLVIGLRRS